MKLYILYKNENDTERFIKEYLKYPLAGEYFNEQILSTANEQLKKDRILSRRLLYTVCEKELGRAPSQIGYNKSGKPCFTDGSASFSISHTKNLILLAFECGSCNLGADVQIDADRERLSRVYERFKNNIPTEFNREELFVEEITLCNVRTNFFTLRRMSTDLPGVTDFSRVDTCGKTDPLTAWTLTEAVLKAEGEGFGAICRCKDISKDYSVASFNLKIGGKAFSISVAKAVV